jgi:hypothetical protein
VRCGRFPATTAPSLSQRRRRPAKVVVILPPGVHSRQLADRPNVVVGDGRGPAQDPTCDKRAGDDDGSVCQQAGPSPGSTWSHRTLRVPPCWPATARERDEESLANDVFQFSRLFRAGSILDNGLVARLLLEARRAGTVPSESSTCSIPCRGLVMRLACEASGQACGKGVQHGSGGGAGAAPGAAGQHAVADLVHRAAQRQR